MYEVPFYVKVAVPGNAFHDLESKFFVDGNTPKEVKILTPLIRAWLQNGGLVETDEDGKPLHATSTRKANTQTFGKTSPADKEAKAEAKAVKEVTATPETPDVKPSKSAKNGKKDVDKEPSLEELLSGAGEGNTEGDDSK